MMYGFVHPTGRRERERAPTTKSTAKSIMQLTPESIEERGKPRGPHSRPIAVLTMRAERRSETRALLLRG